MSARVKPSKALLATTHEASELDYSKLSQAVIRACIARDKNVIVALPYFCKVDPTFPIGVNIHKDGLKDYFKIKTVKLANWLYERGWLPCDHKNLMLQLRQMAYMEARINGLLKMDKISVDSGKVLWDNDGIEVVEEKENE